MIVQRDIVDQLGLVEEGNKDRPARRLAAAVDPNGQLGRAPPRFDDDDFSLTQIQLGGVVGMHFRGAEAKEYVSAMREGEVLTLEREPENPYDQNAIKVFASGIWLGYIDRSAAAWISGWLDEGHSFTTTVVGFLDERNNRYPLVDVVPNDEPA